MRPTRISIYKSMTEYWREYEESILSFAISKTQLYIYTTISTTTALYLRLKKSRKKKREKKEFGESLFMHLQRNHSRTKVSRFKAGRATSSLSREFTVKIAGERRYVHGACIYRVAARYYACDVHQYLLSALVVIQWLRRVYHAAHSDFDGETLDYRRRMHEESSRFSNNLNRNM